MSSSSTSRTSRLSNSEVIEYVVEYKKIVKELDALKNEIAQLRNKLRPRLTKLTKDKEKYETIILDHLEKHQDPGLKYQNIMIYKEPRKFYPHKKEKDEKLSQLMDQYNITDPNFMEQITNIMKSRKMVDSSRYTLKMKDL